MAIGGGSAGAPGAKDGSKGSAGRYAFIIEVARGYLGPLWLARDPAEPARPVFIRHVAPLVAASARAALLEAAHWAEAGDNDCEAIESKNSIEVVTPYLDGDPLRTLLRSAALKQAAPSPALVLGLVRALCAEVTALHESRSPHAFGGVHPDSIFLDVSGAVHLIDVGVGGVASAREPWRSDPQRLGYAAPEQLDPRGAADARADVFAIGVLLWEALTNRRLFPGNDAKTVRERVHKGPIARLDATRPSAAPGISTEIADVVARALDRNPAARHQTPSELAAALSSLGPADPTALGAWVVSLSDVSVAKRRQVLERTAVHAPAGAAAAGQDAPAGARASIAPGPAGARASIAPGPAGARASIAPRSSASPPEPSASITPPPPATRPSDPPRLSTPPPKPSASVTPPPPAARPPDAPRLSTPPPKPGASVTPPPPAAHAPAALRESSTSEEGPPAASALPAGALTEPSTPTAPVAPEPPARPEAPSELPATASVSTTDAVAAATPLAGETATAAALAPPPDAAPAPTDSESEPPSVAGSEDQADARAKDDAPPPPPSSRPPTLPHPGRSLPPRPPSAAAVPRLEPLGDGAVPAVPAGLSGPMQPTPLATLTAASNERGDRFRMPAMVAIVVAVGVGGWLLGRSHPAARPEPRSLGDDEAARAAAAQKDEPGTRNSRAAEPPPSQPSVAREEAAAPGVTAPAEAPPATAAANAAPVPSAAPAEAPGATAAANAAAAPAVSAAAPSATQPAPGGADALESAAAKRGPSTATSAGEAPLHRPAPSRSVPNSGYKPGGI